MTSKKIELLSIGHSYVVALNRSLMRELNKSEHIRVTVASPNYFAGDLRKIHLEDEPMNSDLRVVGLDCYGTSSVHLFFYHPGQLKQLIKHKKWDYGYSWEEPYIVSGFQLGRAFAKNKIPFSLFTNQNIIKKYPWPFSTLEKQTLAACDSLWGCGPQVINTFLHKGYQGDSQIVPYFVSTDRFKSFTVDEKKQSRFRFGLQDIKTIGFMGRLTEEKGCRLFLKSLESLPLSSPWQALILGDGPLKSEIQNWIHQKGLHDRVFLKLMKHEEIPQILPVMDLMMCPSQTTSFWREQFGRMIIEAFACGVPVIASDSGEIPFVVGDAGVIVPEKSETLWQEALKDTLWDENRLQKMRAKGFERAATFSVQTIARQIEQILVARFPVIK